MKTLLAVSVLLFALPAGAEAGYYDIKKSPSEPTPVMICTVGHWCRMICPSEKFRHALNVEGGVTKFKKVSWWYNTKDNEVNIPGDSAVPKLNKLITDRVHEYIKHAISEIEPRCGDFWGELEKKFQEMKMKGLLPSLK